MKFVNIFDMKYEYVGLVFCFSFLEGKQEAVGKILLPRRQVEAITKTAALCPGAPSPSPSGDAQGLERQLGAPCGQAALSASVSSALNGDEPQNCACQEEMEQEMEPILKAIQSPWLKTE